MRNTLIYAATALMMSARQWPRIARICAIGADGSLTDKEGKTPYDMLRKASDLHGSDVYRRLSEGRFR